MPVNAIVKPMRQKRKKKDKSKPKKVMSPYIFYVKEASFILSLTPSIGKS